MCLLMTCRNVLFYVPAFIRYELDVPNLGSVANLLRNDIGMKNVAEVFRARVTIDIGMTNAVMSSDVWSVFQNQLRQLICSSNAMRQQ